MSFQPGNILPSHCRAMMQTGRVTPDCQAMIARSGFTGPMGPPGMAMNGPGMPPPFPNRPWDPSMSDNNGFHDEEMGPPPFPNGQFAPPFPGAISPMGTPFAHGITAFPHSVGHTGDGHDNYWRDRTAIIAGSVVGGLAVVGIIAGIIAYMVRKRRNDEAKFVMNKALASYSKDNAGGGGNRGFGSPVPPPPTTNAYHAHHAHHTHLPKVADASTVPYGLNASYQPRTRIRRASSSSSIVSSTHHAIRGMVPMSSSVAKSAVDSRGKSGRKVSIVGELHDVELGGAAKTSREAVV